MADCQDCGKRLRRPEAKRCAVCQSMWYQANNMLRLEHLTQVRACFVVEHEREPSIRELAAILDWSVSTVHHYLTLLKADDE